MRKGNVLTNYFRKKLIEDTIWWIDILTIWSDDKYFGNEYRIFSATEIQKPNQVYILQSDSSGTDGFGYHGGYLGDNNQVFTSKRWLPHMFLDCNKVGKELNLAGNLFVQMDGPPPIFTLSAEAKVFQPNTPFATSTNNSAL